MKRNILTLFAGNTPLRRVANIWQQNFIAAFINDLQGIGCRVEIPPDRGGMGARIIVDGSSDISPPGETPWEASSDAPFPFELYRDEDALKIRAGTLYRIEDGVTEARPLEDTGGQPDESATVLAEIPATAEKKIWVEKSSEDITLECADAFPADRDDEIGVEWWPVGIVSTDAGANVTELDQYLLGHIYQAVSGDALTALDDISIDKNSSDEVQIKDWETASAAESVAETALFPFRDTDGTLKYAQPGDIPVDLTALDDISIDKNSSDEVQIKDWETAERAESVAGTALFPFRDTDGTLKYAHPGDIAPAPPLIDMRSLNWDISDGLDKAQWYNWDQWTSPVKAPAETPPHKSSLMGIKRWNPGSREDYYSDELEMIRLDELLALVDPDPVDERSIDRATISGVSKIEIKGWNSLTSLPDPSIVPGLRDAIPMKVWDAGISTYKNVVGFRTVSELRDAIAVPDERSISRVEIADVEKLELKGWSEQDEELPVYEPKGEDAVLLKKWNPTGGEEEAGKYEHVAEFATVANLRSKLLEFIWDALYEPPTISDPPSKAEVEAVSGGAAAAIDKINELLAALLAAGIMPPDPEEE